MGKASKKDSGFGVVEVLVLVLVVAVIGFIGFTVYNNFNKAATTTTPSLEATPASETSGWQAYTSEKEGLSISYPSTWTYKNTKAANTFDDFTLTGPGGFVIRCLIATIPLDGGEFGRKVVFADELPNANYTRPLYVVGHYDPQYSNNDTLSVTDVKYTQGQLDAGPRGYFASKIVEKMGDEMGSNFVYLQGAFPLYKDSSGNDASPAHVDFDTNEDLKTARQILSTLKYN